MKTLLISVAVALLISSTAFAQQVIYPTLPGTSIPDPTAPRIVVMPDGRMYQTVPGANIRDYNAPGYVQQGHNIQRTVPGTYFPDYTQPGYVIQ